MKKTFVVLGVVILLLIVVTVMWLNRHDQSEAKKNIVSQETEEYVVPSKYKNIKVKTINEQSDDDNHRYTLHASWPVTENEVVNDEVAYFANQFVEEYQTQVKEIEASRQQYLVETGEDGATFHADYNMSFDVAFASDDYMAFAFTRYRNTGNTGNDQVTTMIFDRQSGKEIPTGALFTDQSYLDRLSQLVRKDLYARVADEANKTDFGSIDEKERWESSIRQMIDSGTTPKAKNFNSIVIDDSGEMTVYLDKYQAAPGYWGVLEVILPLKDFADLLTPTLQELFDLTPKTPKVEARNDYLQKQPDFLPPPNDSASVDCTTTKCVALTFDDGPSVYTEGLLKTLVDKGVKATFYMLGSNAKVQQQTVIDVSKAGMEIGNHTWDHKQLTKLDEAGVDSEINDTRSLLEKITGKSVAQLRPPYGSFNDTVKQIASGPIILWNVDTEDWKHRDSAYVKNYVATHAKPGAIILMHDIHPTTVEAVPAMVDELKQAGYTIVTVSELFGGHLVTGKVYSGR